ncbi:PHP domain-containing protein [Phascolarctobacterium succinatutens]|uniref:PHP domain-containing protein n=1 Tax=Phascolarctobacterium succinatutens TaxID=626940 RepID=UPI004029395E
MSERADLHIHTTASDGTWTPAELIAEAQKQQLGLIAVTDHDSDDVGSGSRHYAAAGGGNLLHQGGFVVSYSWLWH